MKEADMSQVAPIAMWAGIAVIVLAGVWREIVFRREAEATIRLAIEKGQALDSALIEKLFAGKRSTGPEGFLVAGVLTLAAGIGLPILGYFIRLSGNAKPLYPMMGVGVLVSLVGIAQIILSALLRRRRAGPSSEHAMR
jgi:hypothetical protein